jgi:hypothetical protein
MVLGCALSPIDFVATAVVLAARTGRAALVRGLLGVGARRTLSIAHRDLSPLLNKGVFMREEAYLKPTHRALLR